MSEHEWHVHMSMHSVGCPECAQELEETEMDDEIKLGRVGHYSWQNACQEASIVHVHPKQYSTTEGGELPRLVNVHGHDQEGDCFSRRGVPFGHTEGPEAEFHLNRDCPDQK